MRITLLGPPGAGKGTQAERLADKYGIPHISTGDIFRKAMADGSDLGKEAKNYMDRGLLVPDEVTIGIVKARLNEQDCQNGFLLDGFPRTVNQADALEETMRELGMESLYAVNILLDAEKLFKRITGRRVCESCGATYHIEYSPPQQEGVCDLCSGKLIQRNDDKPETVVSRIEVYEESTAPLTDYYREKGVLLDIDGDQDMDAVFSEILSALENQQ